MPKRTCDPKKCELHSNDKWREKNRKNGKNDVEVLTQQRDYRIQYPECDENTSGCLQRPQAYPHDKVEDGWTNDEEDCHHDEE